MTVTLIHRFIPNDYYRERRTSLRVHALLVRDPQGLWRPATPDVVLPLAVTEDTLPSSYAELVARYHNELRDTRGYLRDQAVTYPLASAPPCSAPTQEDAVGDETVLGGDVSLPPRDPRAHRYADLIAFGAADACVVIRTAGALPSTFELRLQGDSGPIVEVDHGTVFMTLDDGNETRVKGEVAYVGGNEFVLRLPPSLAGLDISGVRFAALPDGTEYDDEAY